MDNTILTASCRTPPHWINERFLGTEDMGCFKTSRICCASEPFILLYFIAVGLHLSVVPQLLLQKLCLSNFNTTVCSGDLDGEENIIHKQAAHWNMIIFLIVTGPSIISVLIFGTISDMFSKKYLLIAPPIAIALQSVVYLVSSKYMWIHVGFLVAGAGLTCFYGDIIGAATLGYSYVADITDTSGHRTFRMAFVESSLCIGQATGSFIGGMLLHKFGFVWVFVTSLIISVINLGYVLFVLPKKPTGEYEDIESDDDEVSEEPKATCSQILFKMLLRLKIVIKYFSYRKKGFIVVPLVVAVLLVTCAIMGENMIIVLFARHSPLSLKANQVGQFLLLLHTSRGIGVFILSAIAIKCYHPQDYVIAAVGTGALVITHVVIATAKSLKILFAVTPFSAFIPLALSSLRSAITKQVSPTHHGTALALTSSISLIGVEVIAGVANGLYKATESTYPGAALLLLASMSTAAFLISGILYIYSMCTDNNKSIEDREIINYSRPLLLNGIQSSEDENKSS